MLQTLCSELLILILLDVRAYHERARYVLAPNSKELEVK